MEVRLITEDDHHDIKQWFKAHKWPSVDFALLPPTGWTVPGVCAAWLYLTNSRTAILEWVISNPKSIQRQEGLNDLLRHIARMAKDHGCLNIFTATKHAKLVNRLQIEHDYLIGDEGVTHLMKIL
jgi:hypothetical protein